MHPVIVLVAVTVYVPPAFTTAGLVAFTSAPPFQVIVLPALVPVNVDVNMAHVILPELMAETVGLTNGGVDKINPAPQFSLSVTKATTCGPGYPAGSVITLVVPNALPPPGPHAQVKIGPLLDPTVTVKVCKQFEMLLVTFGVGTSIISINILSFDEQPPALVTVK